MCEKYEIRQPNRNEFYMDITNTRVMKLLKKLGKKFFFFIIRREIGSCTSLKLGLIYYYYLLLFILRG